MASLNLNDIVKMFRLNPSVFRLYVSSKMLHIYLQGVFNSLAGLYPSLTLQTMIFLSPTSCTTSLEWMGSLEWMCWELQTKCFCLINLKEPDLWHRDNKRLRLRLRLKRRLWQLHLRRKLWLLWVFHHNAEVCHVLFLQWSETQMLTLEMNGRG